MQKAAKVAAKTTSLKISAGPRQEETSEGLAPNSKSKHE